ncbi:NO-inducible flavohemoprotein [Cyclobacterium sp. SYSU L10401]|uniref:NO-inducible flavohemoprotein n=1 Tax=Cyclobacterium sp. SYSU L10401 TaxID=2678657 RepID=UPI0013D143E6|nr:NO-inducible flavohemoprotein [Cyclobacterium sp. SYSU L10401]
MINKNQQQIIAATAPILKEHGLSLTSHFYKRMFQHHPELKNMFNMGNQKNGKQQQALAMALLAYAEHISNPEVLLPDLNRIGHKHVSLEIRPEHYPIVGNHLLAAIKEVLGDAATKDILNAWEAAYEQLAELMIGLEKDMYRKLTSQAGGWTGWRPFTVVKKEKESSEISSFYLYPADKGKVIPHQPGQFISLKLFLPDLGINQARQYSISSSPNQDFYRISVKREYGAYPNTNGMISNQLHDQVQVGDVLELTAPAGNFTLDEKANSPLVLISGGVGLTPLISMLQSAIEKNHETSITWIHGCRNQDVHAFGEQVRQLEADKNNLEQYVFYDWITENDKRQGILEGPIALNKIPAAKINPDSQYYICGPAGFIEKQYQDLLAFGVQQHVIFFEEFGPQQLALN